MISHSKRPKDVKHQPGRTSHKRRKTEFAVEPSTIVSGVVEAQSHLDPSLPPPPPLPPPILPIEPVDTSTLTTLLSEILPAALGHLHNRYALATMSIISSSKITSKVRNLLTHMERFSFVDLKAKPGVVVLHAKASAAGKLISVVEIAKREIEKEKGKWWQYSRVDSRLEELKERARKKETGSAADRTIRQWEEDQEKEDQNDHDGVEERDRTNEVDGDAASKSRGEGTSQNDEDDGEDAFQTMGTAEKGGISADLHKVTPKPRVRAVPVMTIYMSRVPVPEFRELYGEQSNA